MTSRDEIHVRYGFTIWELLCIVIVIIVLIGLLMPALSRVRSISTRMVCGTTLSGYGKAMLIYLNDNNDKFPDKENEWFYTELSFNDDHPLGCRWHDLAMAPDGKIMENNPQFKGLMWDYINPNKNNVCPQFRAIASSKKCPNPYHLKKIDIVPQYSYTMNAYLGSDRSGGVSSSSQVRNTGKVFVFAEENSWTIGQGDLKFRASGQTGILSTRALDDTMLTISPTEQALDCFATYHDSKSVNYNSGCCNAVFVDSHVESITIEDQLNNDERGWPQGTMGNITYAWAAKTLPVNDND